MNEHKITARYRDNNIVIDALEQKIALVHFYFGVDIDELKPEQKPITTLAKLWSRLEFALEFDGKLKA